MGCFVRVRRSKVMKCPHCGIEACLKTIEETASSGDDWRKILRNVGIESDCTGVWVRVLYSLLLDMEREIRLHNVRNKSGVLRCIDFALDIIPYGDEVIEIMID